MRQIFSVIGFANNTNMIALKDKLITYDIGTTIISASTMKDNDEISIIPEIIKDREQYEKRNQDSKNTILCRCNI